MAQPKVFEGTGAELQRMLVEFPQDRFRAIQLLDAEPAVNLQDDDEPAYSLFDLLGDYVGSVDGSADGSAARVSELFAEYVVQKRNEGHL